MGSGVGMHALGFFLLVILISAVFTSAYTYANLSLDCPLVKNKLEPWLWDKLKLLEANGTTRFYTITISMIGFSPVQGYEGRKGVADFLKERHNATILSIGKVLNYINLRVRVPEIKRIAWYYFVELVGDGERIITPD